jgi:acetyl esterase
MLGRVFMTLSCLAISSAHAGSLAQDSERAVVRQPSVLPQPLSIDGAATHVYKSLQSVDLRLHVFSPADRSAAVRPGIVFFFGGGWSGGTIVQFVPHSKHLAARGMVAIVADYRVQGRHNTSPFEAMADAKSAIRWVRSRAATLGIDPDRIAAGGGSSGGHIALSAAVFESFDELGEGRTISSKPNALVLFNPAVETSKVARFGDRGAEGSPLLHLTGRLPPVLVVHGKADTIVPYEHVESFCSKARGLGGRCELIGYAGAQHGFFNPRNQDGKWYRETLLEADRFLTSIGYLLPPSPDRISY